jgi:hypothetical protein
LSSSGSFPASTSQPLHMPVKQAHRTPSYTYISNSHLNPQPCHTYTITTTAPAFTGRCLRMVHTSHDNQWNMWIYKDRNGAESHRNSQSQYRECILLGIHHWG